MSHLNKVCFFSHHSCIIALKGTTRLEASRQHSQLIAGEIWVQRRLCIHGWWCITWGSSLWSVWVLAGTRPSSSSWCLNNKSKVGGHLLSNYTSISCQSVVLRVCFLRIRDVNLLIQAEMYLPIKILSICWHTMSNHYISFLHFLSVLKMYPFNF